MTTEQILLGVLGVACTCIGWFANQLYRAIEKLKEDLGSLEVRIGTDFVRYDRLQDMLRPIAEGIVEIKATLAHKADKP
jgi:hypothetical protein